MLPIHFGRKKNHTDGALAEWLETNRKSLTWLLAWLARAHKHWLQIRWKRKDEMERQEQSREEKWSKPELYIRRVSLIVCTCECMSLRALGYVCVCLNLCWPWVSSPKLHLSLSPSLHFFPFVFSPSVSDPSGSSWKLVTVIEVLLHLVRGCKDCFSGLLLA